MDRQDGAPGNWHYALAALLFGRRISAQRRGRDMHFDLARLAPGDAYKLLVSTVVPRPIALTTAVDLAGRVNAEPVSLLNAVSSTPTPVVVGIKPGRSAR